MQELRATSDEDLMNYVPSTKMKSHTMLNNEWLGTYFGWEVT